VSLSLNGAVSWRRLNNAAARDRRTARFNGPGLAPLAPRPLSAIVMRIIL